MTLPPSATKMETPIPITISITYDTYDSLLNQGILDNYLYETICPKYPHHDASPPPPTALELTQTTVDRIALMLEKDGHGIDTVVKNQIKIALAKCPICKGRFRILPADILPYKHYTLPVIENGVRLYNPGHLSLRGVAWDGFYGERTPVHATIHGWTEGLGAYWSGRCFGEVEYALPASRIMAELETRLSSVGPLHSIPAVVNPTRYLSQTRLERLEACQRLETICEILNVGSFCEFNRLIINWGNSFGFCFRSAIRSTAFERIDSRNVISFSQQQSKEEEMICQIRGRSPPGDSK